MSRVGGDNKQGYIDMLRGVGRGPVGGGVGGGHCLVVEGAKQYATEAPVFPDVGLRELIEEEKEEMALGLVGFKIKRYQPLIWVKGVDVFWVRLASALLSGECR